MGKKGNTETKSYEPRSNSELDALRPVTPVKEDTKPYTELNISFDTRTASEKKLKYSTSLSLETRNKHFDDTIIYGITISINDLKENAKEAETRVFAEEFIDVMPEDGTPGREDICPKGPKGVKQHRP
jgi:hypothetical protein